MKLRTIKFFFGITLLNLIALPLQTQAEDSSVNIMINPAYRLIVPDSVQMGSAFVDPVQDTIIYQPFSPLALNQVIQFTDLRNQGGFSIDVTSQNFMSPGGVIPYTSFAMVTLADKSSPASVDSALDNIPSEDDNGTVKAPLDCDWNFNGSFGQFCENAPGTGHFSNFTGSGIVSNPQTVISAENPSNNGRVGIYSVAPGFRLTVGPSQAVGDYSTKLLFTLNLT